MIENEVNAQFQALKTTPFSENHYLLCRSTCLSNAVALNCGVGHTFHQ